MTNRKNDQAAGRFQITLPKGVAADLKRWADCEQNKAGTLASFLIEKAVREAKEAGLIPDAALPVSQEQADQQADSQAMIMALTRLVSTLLEGQIPPEGEVHLLAHLLEMTPGTLHARLKKLTGQTNGIH